MGKHQEGQGCEPASAGPVQPSIQSYCSPCSPTPSPHRGLRPTACFFSPSACPPSQKGPRKGRGREGRPIGGSQRLEKAQGVLAGSRGQQ